MDVVLNWIWQGGAVALLTAAILRGLSGRVSASTREQVWWVALAVVVLLPLLALAPARVDPAPLYGLRALVPQDPIIRLAAGPVWPGIAVAALVIVWWVGSLGLTAAGVVRLVRTRRRARPFPADRTDTLVRWRAVTGSPGGRPAVLVLSDEVRSAAVLGLWRPIVAVHPLLLDALDSSELDQILLHEWAHVQRRDDLANLLQALARAAAGFHPAVWWIGRRLDVEREIACDDWVLDGTASAKRYAACLVKLASLRGQPGDLHLMPGASAASQLSLRLRDLLAHHRVASRRPSRAAVLAMLPLLILVGVALTSIQLLGIVRPAQPGPVLAPIALLPTTVPAPAAPTPRTGAVEAAPRRQPPRSAAIAPVPAATFRQPAPTRAAEPSQSAIQLPAADQIESSGPSALPVSPTVPDALSAGATLTDVAVPGSRAADSSSTPAAATPWSAAAEAGAALGRGSQKAGVATAGFFSRVGKSVGRAF